MSKLKCAANLCSRLVSDGDGSAKVAHTSAAPYAAYLPPRPRFALNALGWLAALAVLAALPFVFSGPLGVAVLTQICIAITFAVAYNLLLGGTGLLSFGHALYFGVGAYATAHVLNHYGASVPLVLAPLVGGAVSLVAGAVFALFTVRSGKVIYAMISLAVGQLAFSAATVMTDWSGGDEGIRLNPTAANGWGIDFGSPLAIYLLVAAWGWLATLAMFALMRTPLGRLMQATRDNPERLEFVGFSPVVIRGYALTLSAGFAGVAGALYALGFQVVTMDTLSLQQSTAGLLQAYIGGYTSFFGPVVGATLVTLVSINLSSLTEAWPLYLGAFFVVVIMFMRHGLIELPTVFLRHSAGLNAKIGASALIGRYAANLLSGAMCVAGFVTIVEMIRSLSANMGAPVSVFKANGHDFVLDPHNAAHWVVAIGVALGGLAWLHLMRRRACRDPF
ncbi:MAG TPA: branched-chain amino acid ABC transporter permease [Trinickia sp.]|nr:branched-chain amino acid ABC transporter permease [Trinickia sp.]